MSRLMTLGLLLACGCSQSHSATSPDPHPEPGPDAATPTPDTDAGRSEPVPEPGCPAAGFHHLGGGLTSTEPVSAEVLEIRYLDSLAEALLETSDGETVTFRAPAEHLDALQQGSTVRAGIDRDSNVRATRLRFDGGQIVAFEDSHLPTDIDIHVGSITLQLGRRICREPDPMCGSTERFALRLSPTQELSPGESTTVAGGEPDGSDYLVSHGAAVEYPCELCECVVGAHFSAIVTQTY